MNAAVMETLASIYCSSRLNRDAVGATHSDVMLSSTDSRVCEYARRVGSLLILEALADAHRGPHPPAGNFTPAARHG